VPQGDTKKKSLRKTFCALFQREKNGLLKQFEDHECKMAMS
jgi:hypothetical protein